MRPMGRSAEQVIQHIEANVPPGRTHRDEAAIDVGPQRQACAATKGFELPPHIETAPVVLEHFGSVGSRHCGFGHVQRGRSHRGELHRASNRSQAPVGVEGRPLAQLRGVGDRLPDFLRRVTQLSDENERPVLSVLSHLARRWPDPVCTAREWSPSSSLSSFSIVLIDSCGRGGVRAHRRERTRTGGTAPARHPAPEVVQVSVGRDGAVRPRWIPRNRPRAARAGASTRSAATSEADARSLQPTVRTRPGGSRSRGGSAPQ